MNVLVVGHEANLGTLRQPPLRLSILIRFRILAAVESSKDTITKGLHESLVVRLLRRVNDKQPPQARGLLCPVFLGHDKLDGAAVQLGSLVSVYPHALGRGGAKVLGRCVVGMRAQVADKLVPARSEHHERVDVGSAPTTSRGPHVAEIEDGNLCFAWLERRQRLNKQTERQPRRAQAIGGSGNIVHGQARVLW
jgi:hypothetical protein